MRPLVSATVALAALATAPPATARPDPTTYVAFGDSITAGLGTTDSAADNYATVAGIDSRGLGGRCLVATRAPCVGKPLVDVFAAQLDRTDADVAVVLIGTNDLLASTPPDEVAAGYRRLIATGARDGVRVVLGTLTPGARGTAWRGKDDARQQLNSWIRRTDHVEYARALEDERTYLRPELDSRDGLHPNEAGQALLAQTLRRWIRRDR